MLHVANKEALFADVYRLLRPGGVFAGSDWLTSQDGPLSPAIKAYLQARKPPRLSHLCCALQPRLHRAYLQLCTTILCIIFV